MTIPHFADTAEIALLQHAATGDAAAFDKLTEPHRRALHVHCYRMLGSPFDADDALQETLLAAWRGIGSFEGHSALRTWLTSIATRICLRLISKRPPRLISGDYRAPLRSTADLGEAVAGPVWLEPMPDGELLPDSASHDDPAAALLRREHIGLAYVAMLQRLPGTQRAALLLCEVLSYSAAETAAMLETSIAAINSTLQRARKTIGAQSPSGAPPAQMDERQRGTLLRAFVSAWENHDVTAMLNLLAADVRFTMPPLPAWFSGREFVGMFFAERVFATPWRLEPLAGNGQPGFACYQMQIGDDRFRPGGVVLLRVENGGIAAIESFLDPAVYRRFGMVEALP
jgi:RNA polymerase sigma-70 factor (TIGR02960 family)